VTNKPDATNTPRPQATDTPQPQPQATDTPQPQPQATDTPQPQPQATDTPQPQATNTPKPPPDKTNTPKPTATLTPTRAPTITPTRAPTVTPTRAPTVTPTNTQVPSPTPTDTPVPPTPTDTPVPPTPTDTPIPPSPTPTVGTINVSKVGSPDPATNGAQFEYRLTITNRTGAPITVTQIDDTTDASFTVINCYDTQSLGSCAPPIGPGIQFSWFASPGVPLANNASMEFVIEGNFAGVTPGSQVCNRNFRVITSVGSETRNDTACVIVN
jgi:hypothetical protein